LVPGAAVTNLIPKPGEDPEEGNFEVELIKDGKLRGGTKLRL